MMRALLSLFFFLLFLLPTSCTAREGAFGTTPSTPSNTPSSPSLRDAIIPRAPMCRVTNYGPMNATDSRGYLCARAFLDPATRCCSSTSSYTSYTSSSSSSSSSSSRSSPIQFDCSSCSALNGCCSDYNGWYDTLLLFPSPILTLYMDYLSSISSII